MLLKAACADGIEQTQCAECINIALDVTERSVRVSDK